MSGVPETQVVAVVEFLETMVDPVAAALANAPIDDEPEIHDETLAVQEAQHSLARNWL